MTLMKHEMKLGRTALIIWTLAIGLMLAVCVLIYPEMKSEMDSMTAMFSSMGAFTAAFGMDRINFGEFTGFYSVECGNIIGLGGAFFAALLGISALAKEEKDHTAEFLLTHPLKRRDVVTGKLCSILAQILLLNLMVFLLVVASVLAIGEKIDWTPLFLLHLSNAILQLETALICFGISAFLKRGSLGIGMGVAMIFYFLNLVANITDSLEFLKYFTPFSYTEGADILADGHLNAPFLTIGIICTLIGGIAAYVKYCRKDIA